MKQKTFSVIVILLSLIILPVSSQTEKGKWVFSGRSAFDFAYSANNAKGDNLSVNDYEALEGSGYTLNLTSGFGYFAIENLSIGGEISYFLSDADYENKTSQVLIMPTGTYYFCSGKVVRPLVALGVGYANTSIEVPITWQNKATKSFNGLAWGVGLGGAFFIKDNISIDLLAQYMEIHSQYSDDSSVKLRTNGLGASVGFSIYF